jgi:hypothetical protein
LITARSDDGERQQFRIDSVDADPKDLDGDVRLYGVSVLVDDTWQPYCRPDVEGRAAAIPVEGSWNPRGEREPGSDAITFACTTGAIAKCIRFGYKPWQVRDGVSLEPYHAACMRMVRADYCGDGRTHTVDGTVIDFWDHVGIHGRGERAGHPEVFEAAWSPRGAVYLNIPRWSDEVGGIARECLGRFITSRERALTPDQVERELADVLLFDARYLQSADRRVAH